MGDWIYRHYIIVNTSEIELARDIATSSTLNPQDTGSFTKPVYEDLAYPYTHLGASTMTTQDILDRMQSRMSELTSLVYARVNPDTCEVLVSNYVQTGVCAEFEDLVTAAGLYIQTGEQ